MANNELLLSLLDSQNRVGFWEIVLQELKEDKPDDSQEAELSMKFQQEMVAQQGEIDDLMNVCSALCERIKNNKSSKASNEYTSFIVLNSLLNLAQKLHNISWFIKEKVDAISVSTLNCAIDKVCCLGDKEMSRQKILDILYPNSAVSSNICCGIFKKNNPVENYLNDIGITKQELVRDNAEKSKRASNAIQKTQF